MTNANTTSIAIALDTAKVKAPRQLPKGTMAKIAVATPTAGHSFFDPIDLLEDHMGAQPILHARVLSSLAWMIDSSCISLARSILFERYKEVDHTEADAFTGFCQDVAENLDHPSLYSEEHDGSPEHTLSVMLALANHWHDAAASAATADDRDYRSKSFRELMESEKLKPVDIGTRLNFKKTAELIARGDKAKADRLYASFEQAKTLSSANRIDANKALIPTILEILRTVNRYAVEASRFDHLPLVVQRRLTTFCVGAVERANLELADRLAKQPIAFGHVAEAAFQATEALGHIIVNKYTEVAELENITSQVQTNMNRNEKRKAIRSFD